MSGLSSVSNRVVTLVELSDRPGHALRMFYILLTALLIMLFPASWSVNEEGKFLLAHRRVEPSSFSSFHAAFDASNARIVIEYVLGTMVVYMGYSGAHVLTRLLIAVLFAVGLSVFFSSLSLSPLRALTVLGLFWLLDQQLFGGEWIFGGVESKTFAYAGVLAAFGLALRGKLFPAVILMVLASYFHFLVGGFWFLALLLFAIIRKQRMRRVLRALLFYSLLTLPLFGLIASDQLSSKEPKSAFNADEIYAKHNSFHIAPFSNARGYFWTKWTPGIIATTALIFVFIVLAYRDEEPSIARFILALLCYLVLALLITFLDRNTFFFSKLYLFRPSSVILLFVISYMVGAGMGQRPSADLMLRRLAAGVLITTFSWVVVRTQITNYQKSRVHVDFQQLLPIIERETTFDEIVLIEPLGMWTAPDITLPRRLTRPTLVSWKFIPTNPADLARWHDRMTFRETLFAEGCSDKLQYPVRLLLVFISTTLDRVSNCGPVIWSEKPFHIVRVNRRWMPRRE
jgi:hypothetical protein